MTVPDIEGRDVLAGVGAPVVDLTIHPDDTDGCTVLCSACGYAAEVLVTSGALVASKHAASAHGLAARIRTA